MMNSKHLFYPLLDDVGHEEDYFYPDTHEYRELQRRLMMIQRFADSTEAALRTIVCYAATESDSRSTRESILQLALDHVSLVSLANSMLNDINECLDHVQRNARQYGISSYGDEPTERCINTIACNQESKNQPLENTLIMEEQQ